MKILSLLLVILLLTGCATISGHDGLIAAARKHIPTSSARTGEVSIGGSFDAGDRSLIWFIAGKEPDLSAYPLEFRSLGDGKFKFVHAHNAIDRGEGCYALIWGDGYCFFTTNAGCAALSITIRDKTEIIEVTAYPFMYRLEPLPASFEYCFLDSAGNVIY